MTRDLRGVSTEELQREIAARQAEALRTEKEQRAARIQVVTDNAEIFLKLTPEHDRTSCSDEHPVISRPFRCSRCALLHAVRYGDFPVEDDRIAIIFRVESM